MPVRHEWQSQRLNAGESAGRKSHCTGDALRQFKVRGLQPDIPRDQEIARAHRTGAGGGMSSLTDIGTRPVTRQAANLLQTPAARAGLPHARRGNTGTAQLVPQSLAETRAPVPHNPRGPPPREARTVPRPSRRFVDERLCAGSNRCARRLPSPPTVRPAITASA